MNKKGRPPKDDSLNIMFTSRIKKSWWKQISKVVKEEKIRLSNQENKTQCTTK